MIIAVDFDGTLCKNAFPEIGNPNTYLIKDLIKRRDQGDKVILWTCRVFEQVTKAVDWCKSYGLEFDAVNQNLPEVIAHWAGEGRKIYADMYIDDRAVNVNDYKVWRG